MNITPLKLRHQLDDAPGQQPKYSSEVKNSEGKSVLCGDPKITRALVALMDLSAVNGGAASHWGGPAAIAECMSALHGIMFQEKKWHEKYNFVNDIGHAENGIYALRANLGFGDLDFGTLKGFRSIESKLTGHGESHLYPEGVLMSNGPLSSAVPQAQGLAHADKLLGNERVTVVSMSDGASMEGEAKESFAAIPGLARQGHLNPFVLIISDNNTKLSGRITDDSFDMRPTFEAMEKLGWNTIQIENGNDLQACYSGLEKAFSEVQADKPVFVWLKTTKGFGVKSTAESSSGGHGFPLKAYSEDIHAFLNEITDDNLPEELKAWAHELTQKPENKKSDSAPAEKAQAGLARGAIKAKSEGLPVFSVSSDLQGSTGIAAFQKEFKDSYVDIGIAEANMVSHAAGLSRAGFIPIVDTFAAFGVTKGNLPLVMSSLSNSPMIAIFSHIGFQDAADGASHQSLTYLSALGSIPQVKTIVISTSAEGEELMYQAIKDIAAKREKGEEASSYIFFVGRENYPVKLAGVDQYQLGKAQVIKSGSDGVIVAAGAPLFKAIEASEQLAKEGKQVGVINLSSINHPDVETVAKEIKNSSHKLITVEDHQLIGGLGSQLVHALVNEGLSFQCKSLGVKGHFGQSAYKADHLYAKAGLDAQGIKEAFYSLND
ncbi:MAG: transketolase [Halobacteriovoraceae bacterium]|nr:transketolase [Halobacteriovoraceae bacterium]|tara:strand:- start:6313 stop:8292 length:1980 start_codon:yes stop_codon:yes gene_type:complete